MCFFRTVIIFLLFPLFLLANGGNTFLGEEASARFRGADKIHLKDPGNLLTYVRLNGNTTITLQEATSWIQGRLEHPSGYAFMPSGNPLAKGDEWHQRYFLYVNHYRVHDGMIVMHGKDGWLTAFNGNLYEQILFGNTPALSEAAALKIALNKIGGVTYRWEIPSEEQHLKWETDDPTATYFPAGEALLFPLITDEQLMHKHAWMFKVYVAEPLAIKEIVVDAASGEIISMLDLIQHADVLGTAVTKYSGTRAITTDSTGTTYRLRETGRGNGIETYNMLNGTNYGNSVDFTDDDNYWNNWNAQKDEVATDAHWGSEMTYDYFLTQHGRNSIDDNGFKLRSYVHYSTNYANAFWDGYRMTYGDGSGSIGPLVALDIIAHEISHGLTSYTANLVYSYESGALNEAFSDIFGTAVEFYAKPGAANWTIGENIGTIIRSMSNPKAYGHPNTYHGQNWFFGSGDNGGVHTNSGVLNYWFYLLTVGGSGTNDNGNAYSVNGIGLTDAAAVAYRMLSVYLTNTSQYIDARFYAILSAIDLFGPCSPEVASVTNAMYAIGVGPGYYNGVLGDFTASNTTFCSLPASVSFSNQSVNGMTYQWNFGDGNTSTSTHPMHTYTQPGLYDITLYVDGGSCGADTTIKMGFIEIVTPTPPFVSGMGSCGPGIVTLTAVASDTVRWYDAPAGGNLLHVGSVFATPFLNQSTPYYVVNSQETPSIYGGKPDNTGAGAYFTANSVHYLEFNATAPVFLKSVKVYAGAAGNRTIQLRNSSGTLIHSASVPIPAGQSRIDLDFHIPAGTGLRLQGPAYPDLYRNSGGTSYPYTVGPFVTITKSSAWTSPTGYYYYFYDWELQDAPCISQRVQVMAAINSDEPVADYTYSQVGDLAMFQNHSIDGNVFHWDFGDGNTSNQVSPTHLYTSTGIYNVKLVAHNACGSDSVQYQVAVIITATPQENTDHALILYPNPTRNLLHVVMPPSMNGSVHYRMSDLTGRQVDAGKWVYPAGHHLTMDLSAYQPGVFLLEVWHDSRHLSRKVIIGR